MDNVVCFNEDKTLQDCSYTDETQENCGSDEGAGVNCLYYGSWGSWSSWSSCSKTCGKGIEMRTRECEDPGNAGTICLGSSTERRSCRTANCPVELIGGNGNSYGNLFVTNDNGYFGPVCDDGWTDTAATVVCR